MPDLWWLVSNNHAGAFVTQSATARAARAEVRAGIAQTYADDGHSRAACRQGADSYGVYVVAGPMGEDDARSLLAAWERGDTDRAVRWGQAQRLPSRVAHATHALMESWKARDGSAPLTAAEVCEYDDPEAARTVRHTAAALASARRLGLASGARGFWFATDRAWEMRSALEDRFHAEVPQ